VDRKVSGGTEAAPTYTDTITNNVILVTVTDDTKAAQVAAEAAYASSVLEAAIVDGAVDHRAVAPTGDVSLGDRDPNASSASFSDAGAGSRGSPGAQRERGPGCRLLRLSLAKRPAEFCSAGLLTGAFPTTGGRTEN